MKLFRNVSIIWKLNLLIVLISATVLFMAAGSFLFQYRSEFMSSMASEAETLAQVIAFSSAPALLFNDRESAGQSLAALGARKHVVAACIYDAQGTLFCSFTPRSERQDIPVRPPLKDETYFDDQNLHLFQKIRLNGDVVGTIYIRHDMEKLKHKRTQFFTIAGTIVIVCLLVVVLLSVIFQRVISDPIVALMHAAGKIMHDRDYSVRVEKKSGDEIGRLIDSFNDMIQEVQSRDLYLEDQVARRTAELQAANASLTQEMQERMLVEQEREKLIGELRQALAEVKTLSGLLPICSACKKIRDDKGYWKQIESYLQEHSDAEFTHGICPECTKKLYPELYDELFGNGVPKTS